MSELQDLYESINPIPENLSRCGDGYCQHVYMLIDPYASGYKARFEGFKHGLQHQQSKVDELKLQVAEMKSRLNDAYTDGQSAMYAARQSKVDELQKRVDAALKVVQSMRNEVKHGHMSDEEVQMLSSFADELEQALKWGDQNTEKQPNKHAENIATKGVKGGDQ